MSKRRPAFDPNQLGFGFEPAAKPMDGSLANLEKVAASAVARILKDDERSRYEIAADVSELLDDDVSKLMLDAYASEAREQHNISFARFLALIAATGRYDVFGQLARLIGAEIVVGEEILTVELGHIEAQIKRLSERKSQLKAVAPEIKRGRR
ncbi:MAG: hypothetical protein ACXW3D_04815 [Caulobacteraceae bacterium]